MATRSPLLMFRARLCYLARLRDFIAPHEPLHHDGGGSTERQHLGRHLDMLGEELVNGQHDSGTERLRIDDGLDTRLCER